MHEEPEIDGTSLHHPSKPSASHCCVEEPGGSEQEGLLSLSVRQFRGQQKKKTTK